MAETQRSYSELIALLANNTSGDISEQDIRDLLDSLRAPYGKISMASNATVTTVSVAGTFVKMAGTTVAGGVPHLFTEGTDGKLTYTGASDRHVHIVTTLSLASDSGTNQKLAIKIAKNGVVLDDSLAANLFKAAGDELSMVCHADVGMSTNDYLEIFVTNITSDADILVHDAYFFAMGMFH